MSLGERSRWIDLDGPLHYLDFGGPAGAPVIVCVHGLRGSAVNWSAIAPLLTGRYRVLAPDLAGAGLTRSHGRGTGVTANRALLHRFIETVPAGPVILMGNSMGGMISLLEAAAATEAVTGLVLLDPALPIVPAWPDPYVTATLAAYTVPGLGQVMLNRTRRMSPEAMVARILSLVCTNPSRVPPDVVAEHVELARRRVLFAEAEQDFIVAARSVAATVSPLRGRAYRRAIAAVRCPVLLLHGTRDRLVPVAAARAAARANPSWSLVVLLGIGHVPQLEAAPDTARAIIDWLGSAGRRAAESAVPRPPAGTR